MNPSLSIRRSLRDLPIPKKLTLIIVLFSIVVFALLILSYVGMEILSGSRAYVHGESFWSKAEKGAIYRLTRYALFHDEADYQRYVEDIAVVQGDHLARLELAKPDLNWTAAAQGFIQGRNHPADVNILILMARKLHNFPYMRDALAIWGQADSYIERLQRTADALHQEIISGHPLPQRIKSLFQEVQTIDVELTPLEDNFSYTLGKGARWLKRTLLIVMVVTTLAFLAVTLVIAFLVSRHFCNEIDQLRVNASRIADGDYSFSLDVDAKDEIGDLARSFRQMALQRQQAERLKDEFFANVSHELRTPLTLILSPLELILMGNSSSLPPTLRPALQVMHNNAVRLLQLINGLLDFSKLEAGKIQVHREPVQIADLTKMIYDDFQPMIKERRLQTNLELHPPGAVVMMDRYLYERIIFNLLSNAVKFTRPGGQVHMNLDWVSDRLTLEVSDTGIGIPQAELDNIFQRFRQIEGSSTRRFEGTGIGLALVKEFAALLDGTVSVRSKIGEGSTFTVSCAAPGLDHGPSSLTLEATPLTLRAQQFASATPAVTSRAADGRPLVLIAEDNAEMASHIVSLLDSLCQTYVAQNGKDALEQIRRRPPDLILTDVMMPGLDGLSLCRAVKSNPETASIPVVMLTALTHREALLEGWKAGADEYLFKPFHPKELTTRIQSLLTAHQNEMALRRHALDLEAANRELEAFSYSVSHDLRAPLRAIDGFSRELLANGSSQLDDRNKDDLRRIRAATQRMSQLIDDLLELSRLSRSDLRLETVDLSEHVRQILQELLAADPHRVVDCTIAPGVLARGDAHLLHIALENLLQNAWKFTEKQSLAKIEFGVSERDGKRAFYIRDNGVGFNMAYADKLFGAFQRLHDAKDFPGTGIGLALVQRIIHRHGGIITAEAEENRGALFTFTLPGALEEVPEGVPHECESSSVSGR